MKKASKKLLSFFLAVVMIVTSCSVGFTAFADEKTGTTEKYWNDVTSADGAFDAIGEIVNTALPTILGIQINGQTIGQLLKMSDAEVKNATLQEVVAKASPLLGDALGASTSVDEKTFLIKHSADTGITNDTDYAKYGKYFAYLKDVNAKSSDVNFYDLYTFCENNQDSSNADVKAYCKDKLPKLQAMLQIEQAVYGNYNQKIATAVTAMQNIAKASDVKSAIKAGAKSVEEIGNINVSGVAIGKTTYTGTVNDAAKDHDEVKAGIELAQEQIAATGSDLKINTVAEAIVYYYVYPVNGNNVRLTNITAAAANSTRYGVSFQGALLYIKLAQDGGTPITTKKIGGSEDEKLTLSNYKEVLGKYITDSKYKPGENDYYYITKAVYECLGDLLPDGTSMSMSKTYYKQMDAFASASYEAVNKAILMQSGMTAEQAEKKIADTKFTDDQLAALYNKVVELKKKTSAVADLRDGIKAYIKSSECKMSDEAKNYLTRGQALANNDFNNFADTLVSVVGKDAVDLNNKDSVKEAATKVKGIQNSKSTASGYNLKRFVGYRHSDTCSVIEFFNEIASGYVTKSEIGSVASGIITNDTSSPYYDYIENNTDKAIAEGTSDYKYSYSNYTMPSAVATYYNKQLAANSIDAVNTALNNTIGGLLDPSTETGAMVVPIINGLMESKITLYKDDGTGVLNDLWKNLYNQPMETVFNLLPTLVILIEEVVLPMVVNAEGDEKYQALDAIFENLGITLTKKDNSGAITIQNTDIGITDSSFDLNTIIPGTLAYLTGNKEKALNYCGTYSDFLKSKGFEKVDGINGDTIMFTGVYAADKAIYGLDLKALLAKKMDAQLATGLNELIVEVANFALEASEEYINECAADSSHEDYRYNANTSDDAKITQRGLNNIAVSLPKLLDKIGQKFIKKYGVNSDWTLLYSGKFTTKDKTYRDKAITQTYNAGLEDFKALATENNPTAVLDQFTNAFIGTWINGLLDLVNDTISTNNKLTNNIPLIAGLLNSLGGIGEKSILTDALNGFFDLTRKDDASFTFGVQNSRKGFVGLSNESGYYLISNITFNKNGEARGIIPLVKNIQESNKKNPKYSTSSSSSTSTSTSTSTTSASKKPTLVNSSKANKKYDKSKVLTSKNIKNANSLLTKLDKILASLLDNSSLNDFALNSNENILAGVLTTASNYIGEKNTNYLLTLLDEYLKVFDTTAKDGKVDADKVYSNSNLSNLVTSTYRLLENIIDYVFYDGKTGLIRGGDRYHSVTSAINGIYSPDSLAVRMTSVSAANDLKYKKHWTDVKSVNFGVSSGDKSEFYSALGDALSPIAAVLGAVFTYTYTDSSQKDNLYSAVVAPVFTAIAKHTGADGVISADTWNSLNGSGQLIQGILTPLSSILTQFYKAPATFLVNLVSALGDILNDSSVVSIINSALGAVNNVFGGIKIIIGNSNYLNAPSLVNYLASLISSKVNIIDSNLTINVKLPEKDIIVSLIKNIKISSINMTVGQLVALKTIDWNALANASTPGESLLLIFSYLVDVVLSSPVILGLVKTAAPEIVKLLESLDPAQILAIINAILDVTQSPTEIYWTFKEYAGKITRTFVYPKGITAKEADEAVENLDKLVQNIFPLLKELGVLDAEDLPTVVNGLLFTNANLTKLTTTVYGGIYSAAKKADITALLKSLGLDFSPKGVANILMDSSYGRTYSSAAKSLKKAKSWSKVKKLNWGFKDGSSKAQTGFVNALAALLRPVNDILSVFLAEGKGLDVNLDAKSKAELLKMVKNINVKKSEIGGIKDTDPYGCKIYLEIKNGVLVLTVDSKASDKNSTFKLDINGVAATLIEMDSDAEAGFGTNGYENAVIPLLEAFLCDDVVTYDEYISDYEDAKDNLIIDVLNPIVGLVNKVLEAPGSTLTAILPNLAYFIDSNGLAQAVSNLLAPITSKKGVIGILKKNGIDVDKLIKQIAGKSLGKIVTDALGVNVKLNLKLTDLSKCNIQDIVLPLVKSILKKNKINIKIPSFTFKDIASHGKIVTASSAAKNAKGKYKRLMVKADKGEMFVALLRYVGDVLIKNATTLNKMLASIDAIKKNQTIKDILNCVFSSLRVASKDDIVRAVFYFLTQNGAQDSFFDYSNFKTKKYDFSFGNMDEEFCRKLAPMLDGLVGGLLADKGGLLGLIGGMAYKDDVISSIACGLYGAVDGVDLGDMGSLSALLAKTGIDFSTTNVANLLTDKRYGKKFSKAANVISKAGSWKNVKKEDLKWGVKDRDTFLNALVAVLRPVYGVVDVLLNNGNLNLFNIVSIPGSNGYTSFIVPLLEAFGVYNIKTQYDYRMDMEKAYDALLLDIINPLWDKVEDILNAPIEMLADILPNLSLFFANNGLLQLIDNLLTPVSALLDAVKPIINVNVVLDVLNVDVNALLGKIGIKSNVKVDVYDLKATLEPVIGSENVVSLLNGILGTIKIKGQPLGIVLPEIDWFQLASHGKVISTTSQVATFGTRIAVQSDQDETLIAVLRYLINTINYKNNYDIIVNLLGGLLGGLSDSIAGVVDQVLGMLKGDADTVIESLVDLLQSIAG